MQSMPAEDAEQALSQLNAQASAQWQIRDGFLCRQFKFDNFVAAFGFMTQVALLAERADHHPDWSNCYNTVDIQLTTHVAKGLTQRDFSLAAEIENLPQS